MTRALKLLVFLPYIPAYLALGLFWDAVRILDWWVWYFEDYIVPPKLRRKELWVLIWLCQWPSLSRAHEDILRMMNKVLPPEE